MPGQSDYQVTKEKYANIRHGEAAHRFEFGIGKGTFWSPNGKLLAFYRVDETMVTDYPVLNLTKMPAQSEVVKYPFAGAASHHATVGVFNPEQQTTVYLTTGVIPTLPTNITFSPTGSEIYLTALSSSARM